MECAAPSSFLVSLPLQAFSEYRFRERRDRPLCHLMVRQQTWQESQNSDQPPLDCRCGNREAISTPGACVRRHVQAIRLQQLVVIAVADRLLLCTKSPRPRQWPILYLHNSKQRKSFLNFQSVTVHRGIDADMTAGYCVRRFSPDTRGRRTISPFRIDLPSTKQKHQIRGLK